MLDIVKLLTAPVPWDHHGSGVQLPDRYQALLSDDARKARAFFVATGPVTNPMGQSKSSIPGLSSDETDVPAKLRRVCNDDTITNLTVVSNMRICH